MKRISKFSVTSLILGYAFLYVPIAFLMIFSFNSSQYPGVWTGFSLRWYEAVFDDSMLFLSMLNSFKVGIIAASTATFLGTLAAIVIVRFHKFKLRSIFANLIISPLAMPEVIVGFSILLVILTLQKYFGFPTQRGILSIATGHTTLAIGYVFMIVQSRLQDFDKDLEEAALNLGAAPVQVFFKITLPIIMPALMSGWLLAFAFSLDDVIIASFLTGPGATTLPLLIFSKVRMGITPDINALATLIILTISLIMTVSSFVLLRKGKI